MQNVRKLILLTAITATANLAWSVNASAAIAQYEQNNATPTPSPTPTSSGYSGAAVAGGIIGSSNSGSTTTAPSNNTVIVNQNGKPLNQTGIKGTSINNQTLKTQSLQKNHGVTTVKTENTKIDRTKNGVKTTTVTKTTTMITPDKRNHNERKEEQR